MTIPLLDETTPLARADWRRVESLRWVQPQRLGSRWFLIADGAPVARLVRPGLWSRRFDAATHDTRWTLRAGWLRTFEVIADGAEAPVLRSGLAGLRQVRVERAGAPPLVRRPENWLGSTQVLETGEGHPLVRQVWLWSPLKHESRVRLEESGRGLPDLEALLLLLAALDVSGGKNGRG